MITEYQFQRATLEQLTDCVKWTLNLLQMRDWQVVVYDIGSNPGDYGNAVWDTNTFNGKIWVDVAGCKVDGKNPFTVAIHEVLHLLMIYRTGKEDIDDETVALTLEPIVYRDYCRANKRRIAKEIT